MTEPLRPTFRLPLARSYRFAHLLAVPAFALLLGAFPAFAGGVQPLALSSIPLARAPIVVDGSFSDWPDTHPAAFVPIDSGLTTSPSPALARIRSLDPRANIRACYDDRALYLGIEWSGLLPGALAFGPSAVLHIRTDRVSHFRLNPVVKGWASSIEERIGDADAWKSVSGSGAAIAEAFHPGRTADQEIRIPWPLLTVSGEKPAGQIEIAIDFRWPTLTTQLLRDLPNEVLHRSTHLTFCFLTSQEKLFSLAPDLLSPADWGQLKFVDAPAANETQASSSGTGAIEMAAPRIDSHPKVDGDLAKWNPAQFQTVTYEPGLLGDRFRARVAASFDADFLYVAVASNAAGGPYNRMAESTQAGYGGGDCLQLRLNDGTRTVNLCAWYDSAAGKPALTADSHDLSNPFLLNQGAREAFRPRSNGEGYTQEMAIPWSSLGRSTAPKPGDVWRADFQVWWSGVGPTFTAITSSSLARGGAIPCSYNLPIESNVTLSLFDSEGHLIRSLVKDAHRHPGKNTEFWDGKDQYGDTVAAGAYQVRGLYHPPIETHYGFTIGNPGTPPWPTTDGKGDWLSDEASTQAAVTDGSNVYLAAPGSEKGYAMVAVGPDGKRLWGYQEPVNPRCVSLTLLGQYLYALFSGPDLTDSSSRFKGNNAIGRAYLVCLDKTTGAPAQFSLQHSDLRIATWPYTDHTGGLWDLRVNKTFTPANYEGQTRYFADDVGEATEAVGIAGVGGKLYVSMLSQNQLLVLDASSGKQLDSIPLPAPVGLHALPDGRILAVSAGKIGTLDPASRASTTLIDHDLDAPHDVTTDSNGAIYVSDWGRSFQVKVFTPGGRLLRAIGKPGGRPWIGAWDPAGMLLPRGIAVTRAGKLWVAEDDAQPNRVSVWNAATGAYLRDYIGPAPYGGGGNFWIDPRDSSTVLAAGTLFHVDDVHKTWTPVSTPFRRLSSGEPFTPTGMEGPPGSRTVVHRGKQYIFCSRGEYGMVVFRRDGIRLLPVAAMGCLGRYVTTDGTDRQIWDSDIGSHRVAGSYPAFFRGHQGDNYLWSDTNGDGKVDPDEMQWVHTLGRGDNYVPGRQPESCIGWNYGCGPDGSIYFRAFCKDRDLIYRMDVKGWTAAGAPEYDLASAQPIISGSATVQGLYVNDENKLFVARPYEWTPGKDALDCYDRDGKLLWSMARPTHAQQVDDVLVDTVIGNCSIAGLGNVVATWLWHANFKPYLVTSDGLYITSMLEDTHIGPLADWDESYRQFFQATDGTPYLVNGGNDAFHFLTVSGLGQTHRFSSRLTVTDAEIKEAGEAPTTSAGVPVTAALPIIHVSWPAVAPTVGGDLGDWDLGDAVSLAGSKGRTARVALARDKTNLYLSYDVHGAHWINKGGNWQTLFITGDCVDLMLSAGPGKLHYTAAAGDERLLIAPFQGRPIAVLYRPVVAGAPSPVKLMGAVIDQIVRLDSARIVCRPNANGYTLEASIPLADLGIAPDSADTLRGDVGVIFADETGANRSLRLYYYNQHTGMTADLTTEATLQPGEWGTVELPIGVNLIKNGSFEAPFAARPTDGWAITSEKLSKAILANESPWSGKTTLHLQQTEPVVFPPASYTDPNYDQFLRDANEGKGGAFVQVTQEIPVVGGQSYSLRWHFKMNGAMGGESKNPGHPRGYDALMIWLWWVGSDVREHPADWVANIQSDEVDWRTMLNSRAGYTLLNPPYKAPAGASSVRITIQLVGNAEGRLPTAAIDQVEFAPVEENKGK